MCWPVSITVADHSDSTPWDLPVPAVRNKTARAVVFLRVLFFLLLLLNIVYVLWRTQIHPPPTPPAMHNPPSPSETHLRTLWLLHERPPVLICHAVGPFRFQASAQHALTHLKTRGLQAELRTVEKQETLGYRVYLPPQPTREQARKLLTRLSEQGIEDLYVITEGDKNNGLALGVFSQHVRAQRRVEQFKRLGYPAEIETRTLTLTMYWIDFEALPEQALAVKAELPTQLSLVQAAHCRTTATDLR